MIHAEVRREESGDGNYYMLRYIVFNGELIGTYGVSYGPVEYDNPGFGMIHKRPKDPNGEGFAYGASRDFHKRANERDIEQVAAYKKWIAGGCEGDMPSVGWGTYLHPECFYHDGAPCISDGSSLVEVTTDEQRCFEIAAMMARVSKED